MRTTVSLDPDVAAAVERLRRERGMGVSAALNDLVRRGLVPSGEPGAGTYRLEPHAMGLRIDASNVAEALEQLEGPTAR
jgi:hypothetical protein